MTTLAPGHDPGGPVTDNIPPGMFLDYCARVDELAERERKRMERFCNFCGALTDEGCELCARENQ